jgi:hypothetical protein
MFRLKRLSLVDEKTTTKNKKIFRYFKIKDNVMNKYNIGNEDDDEKNKQLINEDEKMRMNE